MVGQKPMHVGQLVRPECPATVTASMSLCKVSTHSFTRAQGDYAVLTRRHVAILGLLVRPHYPWQVRIRRSCSSKVILHLVDVQQAISPLTITRRHMPNFGGMSSYSHCAPSAVEWSHYDGRLTTATKAACLTMFLVPEASGSRTSDARLAMFKTAAHLTCPCCKKFPAGAVDLLLRQVEADCVLLPTHVGLHVPIAQSWSTGSSPFVLVLGASALHGRRPSITKYQVSVVHAQEDRRDENGLAYQLAVSIIHCRCGVVCNAVIKRHNLMSLMLRACSARSTGWFMRHLSCVVSWPHTTTLCVAVTRRTPQRYASSTLCLRVLH